MVGVADGAAAGLAQPDATLVAVAEGSLHHVGAHGQAHVEVRAGDGLERRLCARRAEPAVAFAKGSRGGRLDGAVLYIN